ncbi:uncharacterized protein LOC129725484 isoform X2 [Wyeomyia smithii]|uniref:uncharacterized protein LOC129725484 isoform X2 n=1 Tax=Wyeomyia smithii TaxID=174621 RepID=UPI00246806DD|nr:uncharacterized protein LOC129725484 isoform X2 [Wyeomyia smithii]
MARNQKIRRSVGLRKTPRRSAGARLSKPRLPEIREANRRKMRSAQKLLRRSLMKEKRKQQNNNQPSSSRRTVLYPPVAPPPPPNRRSTSLSPRKLNNRFTKRGLKTTGSEPIVIDSEDDSLPAPESVPMFYIDTTGGFNDKEVPQYLKPDNAVEQDDDLSVMLMESVLEEGEIRDEDESRHNFLNARLNPEEIAILDDEAESNKPKIPRPKRSDSEDCSVIFCSEVIDLDRSEPATKEPPLEFIPIGYELENPNRRKRTPRKKRSNDIAKSANSESTTTKRMVIIDGNNVAYGHTCGQVFSVKGLEICIQYFKKMGHEVKAVVPQFRLKKDKSTDQKLLEKLYKDGDVLLAPSKNLPGQWSSSYDDRLIISVTEKFDGVIISNDNFRDLLTESDSWKKIIETRVIGYTWAMDAFFLPDDPYGRNGPKLKDLLEHNKPGAAPVEGK